MDEGGEAMKIVTKFKDGTTLETLIEDSSSFFGEGNLIELLKKGKENNAEININNGELKKKYEDLHSVEIVL
jgi:hypothetical protein